MFNCDMTASKTCKCKVEEYSGLSVPSCDICIFLVFIICYFDLNPFYILVKNDFRSEFCIRRNYCPFHLKPFKVLLINYYSLLSRPSNQCCLLNLLSYLFWRLLIKNTLAFLVDENEELCGRFRVIVLNRVGHV